MIITQDQDFWRKQKLLPLLDRCALAPVEVQAYVDTVLQTQTSANLSHQHNLTPDTALLVDIRAAIDELPFLIKQRLSPTLLGVFIGSQVGSSAITDVVLTTVGEVLGAVVLLDAQAFLDKTANSWMTWKENTAFQPHADYVLSARIADGAHDNRQNALQYLLLHEFGHVINVHSDMLPKWWQGAAQYRSTEEYDFLACSWQIAMSGDIIPLLRQDFLHRAELRYYQSENSPAEFLLPCYQALSLSNFASLYASLSCYEDFAESIATYVHTELMGKPWELSIQAHGTTIYTLSEFWKQPRAKRKRQVLEMELGII